MASPPPPYANVTGISRAVMKDSPQETFANYDGNARAGELVVNLDVDPPTLYIGNSLGNLNQVTGNGGGNASLPLSNGNSQFNIAAAGGNVTITSNSTQTWSFNTDATVTFPTITVDLHNGGNQSAQTLQFGDPNQQAVITGPTPAANVNAERLIIQGQRGNGTGEGGDVYLWGGDANTNGGDIKIYAGDADSGTGYGGYINLDAGNGPDGGGQLTLSGGYSSNGQGGTVSVSGGASGNGVGSTVSINGGQSGTSTGGAVNITGGTGQGPGGQVTISGGQSTLGVADYGNVVVQSGGNAWTFDNTGNLRLASGNSVINSLPNNAGDLSGLSTLNLYPDSSTVDDRYLILDPTGPSHLHLRAGGNIDASNVLLYLGGEQTYVQIDDGYHRVSINSYDSANAVSYNWRFDYNGNLVLPGNLISSGASPAPIISGFSSVSSIKNITTPQPLASLTATAGARAFINDANLVAAGNFGANVSNGGANTVPVWSDGTNWYIG